MNESGKISSIIENHVEGLSAGESGQSLLDAPGVLFLGLPLPGKDGDTSRGDRSSGVILGREDVARRPSDLGTERGKSLDENGGLDGPKGNYQYLNRVLDAYTHM